MSDDRDDDLPEAFQAARAGDEDFWQTQEKRIQGASGQPCCTLSGISTGLIRMPGDFAVIIHGEDECASCFLHYGPSSHQFFCTGLTERHFVTGETAEPLDRCLRLVAEQVQPEAIFVLGACPVEVIGDRFERVMEKVQADYPHIPMRALHTSGLKVGSQAAMLDWMYSTLVSLPTKVPQDPRWRDRVGELGLDLVESFLSLSPDELLARHAEAQQVAAPTALKPEQCLAFLGLPSRDDLGGYEAEWDAVLEDLGLVVTGDYPYAASLDDWQAATFPKALFTIDRMNFPKTVNALQASGQQVVDLPLPTGIRQSEAFYRTIAEVYGLSDEMEAAIAPLREAAEEVAERVRARFGGMRMAMGLRMLNNYRTDQLAMGGLGDYLALSELGFDITVMVQGPPEKAPKFAQLFEARGIDTPFEMFPEPWNLSAHIGGDRFDIAYLADHCRGEARKAGVPMIVSRLLFPGFEGVARNAEAIEARLAQLL